MKQIPLKMATMTRSDGVEMELSYWSQIWRIMKSPMDVQGGIDITEMRSSIRILDELDKVGQEAEYLDLEDTDYEYLAKRVNATRFAFTDVALVQFVDDVNSAE